MSDWIKITDRLPDNLENVLIIYDTYRGRKQITLGLCRKQITLGLFDIGGWYYLDEERNEYRKDVWNRVTHWMPLPKLPEVDT